MPPKAVMKSAKNPPGPVTWKAIPDGPKAEVPADRRASATAYRADLPPMVSSALSATNATGMSTACLSWLGTTVCGGVSRNSPTVRDGSAAKVRLGIDAT